MKNGDVGGVSGGNNISWSKDLAKRLDKKDEKEDNKISANVWNDFLTSIGSSGKRISNFITVEDAERSFKYYQSKKDAGKDIAWGKVDDLMNKYETSKAEGTPEKPSEAPEAQPSETGTPSAKAPSETKTYDKGRTFEVKEENGAKTYPLKDGDKKVQLETDKDGNVIAYPKSGENFKATAQRLGIQAPYDDSNPIYKEFCELNSQALERKGGGGWFKVGEQIKIPESMLETLNLDDYAVDNKKEVASYKKAADARSISPKLEVEDKTEEKKANKVVSDAAKFVADVANSDPKPDLYTINNDPSKLVVHMKDEGDNRMIQIHKNDDGTVEVFIDNDKKNGLNLDYKSVKYKIENGKVAAYVNTNGDGKDYNVNGAEINDPKFLDNLTKVMEKIFGKGALTPKETEMV